MIRQAEMFTAIFRRDDDGLTGGEGDLQRFRRHVFCVHVDLHAATALRDGVELSLPETLLAARDPAFFMDAESDAGDRWNFLEQQSESLSTIGRVRVVGQPFNRVSSVGTPQPLVGQRPDAELETEPAPGAFLANEFQ